MSKTRIGRLKRRGSAIVLMLMAVVVLLAIGVGLMALSLHGRLLGVRGGAEIAARTSADAGLSKAVMAMNEKMTSGSWDAANLPQVANESLPNCDAKFSYHVLGDATSGFSVTSVGTSGRYQKRVDATLRLQGLFDYGILAKESITLRSGTIVDDFDSNTLDGVSTDSVSIATTSTDSGMLNVSQATIDGEVLTGVDHYFPSLAPPPLTNKYAVITAKGSTKILTPSDSGRYWGITLSHKAGNPGILEIAGGRVVLEIAGDVELALPGDVELGQGCKIIVKNGASLVMYLHADLKAGNSDGFENETMVPLNLMLISVGCVEGQYLDLKAKTYFCGVVYAPCADVTLYAGADTLGAFVCEDFEMKSSGRLRYDVELKDVKMGDLGALFVVDRWHE